MTITDAKAYFGLIAGATPAGTNVNNNVQVGEALTSRSYAGAEYVWSIKIAGAAAGNVATISLDDNSATAQTTGLPVITDDKTTDFEGVALPATLGSLYGVMVIVTTSDTTSIVVGGTHGLSGTLVNAGDCLLLAASTTGLDVDGTVTITFTAGDGAVEVVAIGNVP